MLYRCVFGCSSTFCEFGAINTPPHNFIYIFTHFAKCAHNQNILLWLLGLQSGLRSFFGLL